MPRRVYSAHRSEVATTGDEPGEPGAHRLTGSRGRCRGFDPKKRGPWARRGRCAVVEAKRRKVRQRTAVGIRGWRGPGSIEDPGFSLGRHQEDSNQEGKPYTLDGDSQSLHRHSDLLVEGRFPKGEAATVGRRSVYVSRQLFIFLTAVTEPMHRQCHRSEEHTSELQS